MRAHVVLLGRLLNPRSPHSFFLSFFLQRQSSREVQQASLLTNRQELGAFKKKALISEGLFQRG
jgi:hypothetical protein